MQPLFPQPERFGHQRRWRLSALIAYEHEVEGKQPPAADAAADRFLTAAQVRERYQVSDMWLWRRLARRAALTSEDATGVAA